MYDPKKRKFQVTSKFVTATQKKKNQYKKYGLKNEGRQEIERTAQSCIAQFGKNYFNFETNVQ